MGKFKHIRSYDFLQMENHQLFLNASEGKFFKKHLE